MMSRPFPDEMTNLSTFLLKRWFLLTLVAGFVVAALWPAALNWTRHTSPRWIMSVTLFISAVTMENRRLRDSIRHPAAAIWAVFLGYTVPPLLGWGIGNLLLREYQIGLLVCTAVPCTLASAVIWTRLGSGDDTTALLATFISTGISWLVTTAWLTWTTGQAVAADAVAMMRDLALTLALPVALGQLARAIPIVARTTTRRQPMLSTIARLLVLTILFGAAHDLSEYFHQSPASINGSELALAAMACLVVHLAALAVGWWSAERMGFAMPVRVAVAFAASQKTLPVSLVILKSYFPDQPLAVVPLLVYHAGQLTCDTILAERWAASLRRKRQQGKVADS